MNRGIGLAMIRDFAQRLVAPIDGPLMLIAGVLLLIAVALFGDVSKGARRWLNLGFMRVHPSELMKIAMPLLLAWFFQQREAMLRLRDYAIATFLLLLPIALI